MSILRANSAPTGLVTATEVKAQTRVDTTADDTLIGDYILAATAAIDGPKALAGRAFGSQTWDYVLPDFYANILVPVPGATSVSAIAYYDTDDAEQALTASTYFYIIERDDGLYLQRKDGVQLPETRKRDDAVTITVAAGGTVPEDIKHACLMTVATWYENREMGEIPFAAHQLINLSRIGWVGA